MTVHVEVVEGIPKPERIVVLVKINQHVTGYQSAGNSLLGGGNDNKVTVRKSREVMVGTNDRDVATRAGGGGKGGVELGSCHLPDRRTREIYLLKDRTLSIDALQVPIDQEMPICQEFYGVGERTRLYDGRIRTIFPEDITVQVANRHVYFWRRSAD